MVKLTIEQNYNSIEMEFETLKDATDVIDSIKDKTTKETKFIIVNETE